MEEIKTKIFSVSLAYTRNTGNQVETDLRVAHIEAINKHEALGKIISQLDEQMKGFVLVCKVVKEFK